MGFSQQKFVKTLALTVPSIEIATQGVDALTIYPSESDNLRVELVGYDAEIHTFSTRIQGEVMLLTIDYALALGNNIKTEKYCVEPPNNVTAVLYIPKSKQVSVFGDQIDITATALLKSLNIAITKGNVYVDTQKSSATIKLFSGNVYAYCPQNTLGIDTRNGIISMNGKELENPYRNEKGSGPTLEVVSVHANVILSTKNEE